MDVSADLQELAHTPVAVVCAGAKMILDIGRTLEYLETMGVPVLGLNTDDFPAFYCRKSGFGVDYNAKDPRRTSRRLPRRSGAWGWRAACSSVTRCRKNTRWISTR